MSQTAALKRRIDVARGAAPGDLLLTGGRIVDVFSGTLRAANVVIVDGMIAGVGPYDFDARERLDVAGGVIAPGLIDAHMHIESTLLAPAAFAEVVVPRGTSAVIADPHEIGNVLGIPGIAAMIEASRGLPLDCWFTAPSCVPASPFEAAGATLDAAAIEDVLALDGVIGLAEMMNFPGVVHGDDEVLAKVSAAQRRGVAVDGHCPGLTGQDLVAYAAAGIETEHECVTLDEALERQACGMLVLVREGTMARNLDALLPGIVDGRLREWAFCTDDILPADLLADGHLDILVRRAIAAGVDPVTVIRHATLVPARHYGRGCPVLARSGAVAPAYHADLVVVDDLASFTVRTVIKRGMIVARDGALVEPTAAQPVSTENTINVGTLADDAFALPLDGSEHSVIGVQDGQIVTRHLRRSVPTSDGAYAFDPAEDVALIACVHRHGGTGRTGVGLVSGYGFTTHGALGTSVGHDAHNLVLTGTNDRDLRACVDALAAMGGGCVAVRDGAVIASMPLPVAGLLSNESAVTVCAQQETIRAAARELGCPLASPYGTLSFLALSVIPSLKITDRGLFDVERFELCTP